MKEGTQHPVLPARMLDGAGNLFVGRMEAQCSWWNPPSPRTSLPPAQLCLSFLEGKRHPLSSSSHPPPPQTKHPISEASDVELVTSIWTVRGKRGAEGPFPLEEPGVERWGAPGSPLALTGPQPPPYPQPHASLREHNVSPWSPASRDVLCDSRCKENEQAAERAGDKKSTLSQALKGLPERGHMHLKKIPQWVSPLLAPARPHPAFNRCCTKGSPSQAGPAQLQADSRTSLEGRVSEAQAPSREILHPCPLSVMEPWKPGSWECLWKSLALPP